MRHMAVQATFLSLDRRVLEDERPYGVGVALGADGELTGGGAHLAAHLGPMGIMTVAALYEPDIDPMAVRPGELSPLRTVTSVAQLSLRFDEEEVDILGGVRTVTVGASDAAGEVFGVGKVLRFQAGLVTFRADRRRLRWTQLLKANDLGRVATTVNVRLPRSVTSLASMLVALEQRCMWCARKVLVPHFLVARLANFCVGVWAACRAGKRGGCLRARFTRVFLCRYCSVEAAGQKKSDRDTWDRSALGKRHIAPNYRCRKLSELSDASCVPPGLASSQPARTQPVLPLLGHK